MGRYTDSTLNTAYVSGGVAGDVIYLKMSEADSIHFRIGHQALLRVSTEPAVDVNAKVISREANGANSAMGVSLLEADDNGTKDISNVDEVLVMGSINPEGGRMPAAVSYDPVKYYNLTGIYINSLNATRTALQTKYRTNPQKLPELKRETFEYHQMEMEKAFMFSIRTENISSVNGMPERTTCGLVPAIKAYAPTNVSDFRLAGGGDTWLEGGEEWLDEMIKLIFRYRDGKSIKSKIAFCGDGALEGINRLVKKGGAQYTITKGEIGYGIEVITWTTVFGTLHLIPHPLFIFNTVDQYSMVICEPARLTFKYIQDTIYVDDQARKSSTFFSKNGGEAWIDGIKECYLTEAGLEYNDPITSGYLTSVGLDSSMP